MRGRGGVVEDIRVSNVSMYNMLNEGILITLRYQPTKAEALSERTPAVNNVHLSNISIRGAHRPVAVYGLEEMDVSKISFNDMDIISTKGMLIENTNGVGFHDIRMAISEGTPLEAKDSKRIEWDKVTVMTPIQKQPYLKFTNCKNIVISNCYQFEAIPVYMAADEKCEDIYMINNVLPGVVLLSKSNGKNVNIKNNILSK